MTIEFKNIGINISTPQAPIHICLESGSEFTDEDVRRWTTGDLTDIDFATGEHSLIIECLAQIIVARIL